ncbi:hypothetical protein [Parashewanella curva]|nr:hypothetical protein [Parashewanella curva]
MTQLCVSDISPASKNKKNNSRLSKLIELQKKIERLEQRNKSKLVKIEKFYLEAKAIIESAEESMCRAVYQQTEKLLSFTSRKSIKGQKREALLNWIEDEIENIEANPFNKTSTQALRQAWMAAQYTELKALKEVDDELIDEFRQMLSSVFEMDIEHDDNELKAVLMQPELVSDFMNALLQEKLASDEKMEEEGISEEHADIDDNVETMFFDDEFTQEAETIKRPVDADHVLKHSDLNKLYKKLATLLHPDKEKDGTQKLQKHELMQQLSKAKKENDIHQLLMMAQQWLPNFELNLSKPALDAMIESLKQKVEWLEEEYHDLDRPSTPQTMVWFRFSESNTKKGIANLKLHASDLVKRINELEKQTQSYTTVKVMNKVLGQRLQPRRWQHDDFDERLFEEIFGH